MSGGTSHTPGPWRIDSRDGLEIVGKPSWPCNRYGKKGEWTVAIVEDLDDRKETRANARLITAAPRLVDAARKAIIANARVLPSKDEPQWIADLRAAVLEATGENQ